MPTVPIKISKKIRGELKKIKIHPRETYDDILERLIKIKVDIENEIRNSGRSNMISIDTIKGILKYGR